VFGEKNHLPCVVGLMDERAMERLDDRVPLTANMHVL
jgi:hypothetical protein